MRSIALLSVIASAAAAPDYDVVVYGSTPAGIAAATAAGRLGMRVALYEPLPMIGGMGAAGNLALHDGGSGSGLALEFCELNGAAYNVSRPVAQPESFVANASFWTMLDRAGVAKVALDCRLTGVAAAATGSAVASITVLCEPAPVTAAVFIDASYDGEIMAGSGLVEYTWGREAASQYKESLAGARVPTADNFPNGTLSALRADGTLIKYVQNISELAAPGEADGALMAFQHRACISGDADRLPWAAPPGYDRDDFLLFERYIEASNGGFRGFGWPPQNLHAFGYPGKKDKYTLCCGVSVAASDQPNLNKGWNNASWERKQAIIADHTYFELGMFYFLSHDGAVPQAVRDEFNKYGLCADEFAEFAHHLPPQLYIRESNRLVGDFVMTQNNIASPRSRPDGIAVSHWWLDKHMTGKYGVPVGDGSSGELAVQLEGNFPHDSQTVPPSYDIPFSMMVPKRGTGTNLLVPVCLSVSSAAFASTRIETMLMGVGTAAGVAAQQLVDGSAATVQDVDVSKVQAILANTFKQIIHVPSPPPAPTPVAPYFDVSGAGSAVWNGRYALGTDADGDPTYTLAAPGCPYGEPCSLYAYEGAWRLASPGKAIFYDTTTSAGNQPPSSGWLPVDGDSPGPTLAAGPSL